MICLISLVSLKTHNLISGFISITLESINETIKTKNIKYKTVSIQQLYEVVAELITKSKRYRV